MALRSICLVLALTLVFFAALSPQRAAAIEPVTFYGFDEASHSPEAHEGMEAIFSGRCFHSATPLATARLMLSALAGSKKKLGYDPSTEDGRFFAQGRFASPPTRASGLGDGFGLGESVFKRDGVEMVNGNCFSCHAGVVNGQVVAGLGNNHINQSRPNQPRTRGDNFGPYAVWRLSARMEDPANKGMVLAKETTELEELLDASPLPPVDPMPWWLMKYKKLDYWYADAGIHDAASFSINFTTPHDEINEHRAEHMAIVAKALAFARETQSPPYPGSLDAALVRQGADLFHGRTRPTNAKGFRACKTCHGTYTKKDPQADYSQPGGWNVDYDFSHVFRNVKTDPEYNNKLQTLAPIAEHINKLASYYEAEGTPELTPSASVPDKSGYIAPPLVGVWASAPYFHNGSVPTIETVLNSSKRPEIWSRNASDPHAYDLEKVGMQYESLSRDEFDASAKRADGAPFLSEAEIEHGSVYDTKAFGHGNMGHPFGDMLNDEERFAVIEFLKSLSGPDM
mgnify:FL=1